MRKFIVCIDFSDDAEREASGIAELHGATESQRYLARLVEMTLGGGNVDTVTVVGPCCECGQLHEGYEPDPISPCGHYHPAECPNSGK